jgi:hypothetical protein
MNDGKELRGPVFAVPILASFPRPAACTHPVLLTPPHSYQVALIPTAAGAMQIRAQPACGAERCTQRWQAAAAGRLRRRERSPVDAAQHRHLPERPAALRDVLQQHHRCADGAAARGSGRTPPGVRLFQQGLLQGSCMAIAVSRSDSRAAVRRPARRVAAELWGLLAFENVGSAGVLRTRRGRRAASLPVSTSAHVSRGGWVVVGARMMSSWWVGKNEAGWRGAATLSEAPPWAAGLLPGTFAPLMKAGRDGVDWRRRGCPSLPGKVVRMIDSPSASAVRWTPGDPPCWTMGTRRALLLDC